MHNYISIMLGKTPAYYVFADINFNCKCSGSYIKLAFFFSRFHLYGHYAHLSSDSHSQRQCQRLLMESNLLTRFKIIILHGGKEQNSNRQSFPPIKHVTTSASWCGSPRQQFKANQVQCPLILHIILLLFLNNVSFPPILLFSDQVDAPPSSTLHSGRSWGIIGLGDNMTECWCSEMCLLPVR